MERCDCQVVHVRVDVHVRKSGLGPVHNRVGAELPSAWMWTRSGGRERLFGSGGGRHERALRLERDIAPSPPCLETLLVDFRQFSRLLSDQHSQGVFGVDDANQCAADGIRIAWLGLSFCLAGTECVGLSRPSYLQHCPLYTRITLPVV